jgi:hypothetical protein
MRPLKLAPKWTRDRFSGLTPEDSQKAYLCGNCYFDLEDEKGE